MAKMQSEHGGEFTEAFKIKTGTTKNALYLLISF